MATLKVRQLVAVGTRKTGTDADGNAQYEPNRVGDEYDLDDEPLPPAQRQPGGPATLVASYTACGYVELVE